MEPELDRDLPVSFHHFQIEENVYRSNITSQDELDEWIDEYSQQSRTNWRVKKSKMDASRYVCRKVFYCHHSSLKRVHPDENKRGKSKVCGCEATIDILVKLTTKDTMKKDHFVKDGMPAVISFKSDHNHTVVTGPALSFLRPTKETRQTFEQYFCDGLDVAEAIKLHEAKLELESDNPDVLIADASLNPKPRTVEFWHQNWRKTNFGSRDDESVFQKLKERKDFYEKAGVLVVANENPFAILIMTPIMKRAHALPFAKDIVFVDSTASCDSASHSITFMLTPCHIGAVPLAVFITKGQTQDDYASSFKLLKENFPTAFGNIGHPAHFMTDDAKAEWQAINSVWPDSSTLLCQFHVGQSVWRWLWNKENGILKEHRGVLYKLFQAILLASNTQAAECAYKICCGMQESNDTPVIQNYPKWVTYINGYWARKEKWALAWRSSSTHGHQTNNFSEITVRLFKDIVLLRSKAYNTVAVIEFVHTSMETYYCSRLRKFANGRIDKARLFLESMLQKGAYAEKEKIRNLGHGMYLVPKQSELDGFHEVSIISGACSCAVGRLGRFCKHQAAVLKHFNEAFPNAPPTDAKSRFEMAQLALGDKVPPLSFYLPLIDANGANQAASGSTDSIASPNDVLASPNITVCEEEECVHEDSGDENLSEQLINIIKSNHEKFGTSKAIMKKFVKKAQNCTTRTAWDSFLATAGINIPARYKSGSNIKVQPTSVSRRKPGVTRGSRRLPVGRPPTGEKRKTKRKRNLSYNVARNQPNASSHGVGH